MASATATRILLELSILVLITAAATTAMTEDMAFAVCRGWSGGDMAVAGRIKKSLVQDLIAKLPHRPQTDYCNELTLDGLKMNGYAECLGRDLRGDDSRRACTDCLALVGNALIDSCAQNGAGYANDLYSVCSFAVGYNLDVCPKGSY